MNNEISHDIRIATAQHRIGAAAVDLGLSFVTLGIGFFVWSMVTWTKGQTPVKNLLKLRVVDVNSLQVVSWGRMAIRQFLIPFTFTILIYLPYIVQSATGDWSFGTIAVIANVATVVVFFTVQIIDFVWLIRGEHRRIVDYLAKTLVINESN